MTDDERFEILDDLCSKLDDAGTSDGPESVFVLCHELFGGLCNSTLPLWTGYDGFETRAFIQAAEDMGCSELAVRLNAVEGWIRSVPGFGEGAPELSEKQESELESISMDFDKLVPDPDALLYSYADRHGLL